MAAFLIPLAMAAISAASAYSASQKRKEQEAQLESMANQYKPNQSILDYYNKALSRYSANPYASQLYQQQQGLINRNLATGIQASQDKRGGLGTVGALVQGANDASVRAGAMAEQQQGQQLAQLGQASAAKTREERYPFEMRYNLLAQKAGQSATRQNIMERNAFGGLMNAAMLYNGNNNNNDTSPQGNSLIDIGGRRTALAPVGESRADYLNG